MPRDTIVDPETAAEEELRSSPPPGPPEQPATSSRGAAGMAASSLEVLMAPLLEQPPCRAEKRGFRGLRALRSRRGAENPRPIARSEEHWGETRSTWRERRSARAWPP